MRRGAIESVVFELQQVGQIVMASKFMVFLVHLFATCMAVVNSQSQTQTTVSFYCTEMCEMNLSYKRCAWYKYSSTPVLSVLRKFPLKKTITVGGGGSFV